MQFSPNRDPNATQVDHKLGASLLTSICGLRHQGALLQERPSPHCASRRSATDRDHPHSYITRDNPCLARATPRQRATRRRYVKRGGIKSTICVKSGHLRCFRQTPTPHSAQPHHIESDKLHATRATRTTTMHYA
eukprot:1327654-Pyramimonas_sp.AAC.1